MDGHGRRLGRHLVSRLNAALALPLIRPTDHHSQRSFHSLDAVHAASMQQCNYLGRVKLYAPPQQLSAAQCILIFARIQIFPTCVSQWSRLLNISVSPVSPRIFRRNDRLSSIYIYIIYIYIYIYIFIHI